MANPSFPRFIFHVAAFADWIDAKTVGEYRVSTLGHKLVDVGFIHACRADQVAGVANSHYRGLRGLVLLVIDPKRVQPEIRHEAANTTNRATRPAAWEMTSEHPEPAEETFPHIYGPLNVDAVVEAVPFESSTDGHFTFPTELIARL